MPQDITKDNVNIGTVIYQWTVKEFEKPERDSRWYMIMGGIGIALIVYAIISANYLFAMIIVLFGVILFMQEMQTPQDIPFAITNLGIVVGIKFYRFSELKSFWIVYNPPAVKSLYFGLNNVVKHRLQVSLEGYDPVAIRECLKQNLLEDLDQEEEPLSDRFSRLFRL